MNPMTILRKQWDRVAAWVFVVAGAVVLLLGYWGISGETRVARQIPYLISGGLLGIFLLGVGGMLWVSADLRDEWRELWKLRQVLARGMAGEPIDATAPVFRLRPEEKEEADAVLAGAGPVPQHRRTAVGGTS